MIKKADLIARLKSGEVMTEHYSKQRSSFWIADERINLTVAYALIRDGKVVMSNDGKSYTWKED